MKDLKKENFRLSYENRLLKKKIKKTRNRVLRTCEVCAGEGGGKKMKPYKSCPIDCVCITCKKEPLDCNLSDCEWCEGEKEIVACRHWEEPEVRKIGESKEH